MLTEIWKRSMSDDHHSNLLNSASLYFSGAVQLDNVLNKEDRRVGNHCNLERAVPRSL